MYKKAFTLQETLITMGIIGVLAALLIPSLSKTVPNSNKVMFKKAYHTLEQAVSDLINNDASYPIDQTALYQGSTTVYVEQGFNYTTQDGTLVPAGTNKFCYLLAQELNTIGTISCPATNGTGTFRTTDGVDWTIYLPASQFPLDNTSYTTLVTVDINGTKSPNCSNVAFSNPTTTACSPTTTIPDKYQIGIRYDGKLQINTSDAMASDILSNPTTNTK